MPPIPIEFRTKMFRFRERSFPLDTFTAAAGYFTVIGIVDKNRRRHRPEILARSTVLFTESPTDGIDVFSFSENWRANEKRNARNNR